MGIGIGKNQTFGSLLDLFMGGKQGKWSGALSGLKFRKVSKLYEPGRTRYSGEQLREIRAKKGVGRRRPPIAYGGEFMDGWKRYPAINASIFGWESPNYAEWQSKPRRKARGPAA